MSEDESVVFTRAKLLYTCRVKITDGCLTHLGSVEAGGVDHGAAEGFLRVQQAIPLEQLLKHVGIVLTAVHCHAHALLTALVHPVQ